MRAACCLALLAAAVPAAAQAPKAPAVGRPWIPGVAHYAKWVAGAGAVALTVMAVREHERSANQWDALLALCRTDYANCTLDPGGRYADPSAEALYQTALRYDRRARARLISGQATLILAVGLFLADLGHNRDGPNNIPFSPLELTADPAQGKVRVGVRFGF